MLNPALAGQSDDLSCLHQEVLSLLYLPWPHRSGYLPHYGTRYITLLHSLRPAVSLVAPMAIYAADGIVSQYPCSKWFNLGKILVKVPS
jgi:hypothetical protein